MGYLSVSPMTAGESETGNLEAHRLLETLTRLKEVRRRYASEGDDGHQFTLAADRLDSIISDLDEWLKPGGRPIEFDDLDLRLAAVEEMIETTGFPGYAHIIGSIRKTLLTPAEDSDLEEEPPPPQRFKPPPASVVTRSTPDADLDEWEIRAAAESRMRRRGWLMWPPLVGGCLAAAAALLYFWPGDIGRDLRSQTNQVITEAAEVVEQTVAPAQTSVPIPPRTDEGSGFPAETLTEVRHQIRLARDALHNGNLHLALQHFTAAASTDRHHHLVIDMAGSLIDALLMEADAAFDDSEWELASNRVDSARHIARGLYLDSSAIDQTAEKHAAMTRFEDITPEKRDGFRRAVGHSVRVTLTNGDVRSGRLEAFEGDTLVLEIHSGVEGGGVQFSKKIPLAAVFELRIFDAETPSETVLEP
jgi:hypothetical protein